MMFKEAYIFYYQCYYWKLSFSVIFFINESKIFRKMEALVVIQKVFRKVGLK